MNGGYLLDELSENLGIKPIVLEWFAAYHGITVYHPLPEEYSELSEQGSVFTEERFDTYNKPDD